jgi:general secretion pathway protein L
MSRKVLGLDIRSTSIAAVVVKSSLRESWIEDAMVVPIAKGEADPQGLRAALEAITARMDLDQADCVVSIPAAYFSCRNLFVPFDKPKKIRLVLPFELEACLPWPADEVAVDFSLLTGPTADGQTEIFAVALEKSRLEPIIADLATAGIDPERVAPGGLAIAGCLARSAAEAEVTFCLDIGEDSGAILVAFGAEIRLLRSFPLPPAPEARGRAIRNHVRTTLGALEERAPEGQGIERILVTGAGVKALDLPGLAAGLPVDIEIADLGRLLNVARDAEEPGDWDPAIMDGALALAMAEIEGMASLNFHRSQFPGKKLISRYREQLTRTGILAAAVLLVVFGSMIGRSVLAKGRLERLDQQMAAVFRESFPEVKKVSDPFQQMQINLQEMRKSAALAGETRTSPRSIDVLKSISDSIPEEIAVVIERMVMGPEAITITGTTAAFNSVDEIKGRLERIPGFKKVTINSANTDRSGKEVNFQIKVDL